MVTSCDPINAYTTSATFGVPYNGGYKPDPNIEWLPPDSNIVDDRDDFLPPPVLPPSNMLMKTCEGRRIDYRTSAPSYVLEYDDMTTVKDDFKMNEYPSKTITSRVFNEWNILFFLIIVLAVFIFASKFR